MLVKEIKSLLNEVITEVLNEEEDEKKSDERSIVKLEDTQQLNKTDLNKVAKDIADEFNKTYQSIPEDKLNATLELPMGAITSNVITQIQKRKITTAKGKMQIIPLNIATQKETSSDNQTSAASNLDRYANFQVVPFILANEKGETITAGKGKEEYLVIFLAPALYAIVKNIETHEFIFEFKADPEKGDFYHSKILKIKQLNVAKKELKDIKEAFKTGKFTSLKSISNKQTQRIATNPSEKQGEDKQQ